MERNPTDEELLAAAADPRTWTRWPTEDVDDFEAIDRHQTNDEADATLDEDR